MFEERVYGQGEKKIVIGRFKIRIYLPFLCAYSAYIFSMGVLGAYVFLAVPASNEFRPTLQFSFGLVAPSVLLRQDFMERRFSRIIFYTGGFTLGCTYITAKALLY